MIVEKYVHSWIFYITVCAEFSNCNFFSLDDTFSKLSQFVGFERCDSLWIPCNLTALQHKLENNLYGQPLASKVISSALKGYFKINTSQNPLILSFHGGSGVGKTYTSELIINSLYKKGVGSKYVHYFVTNYHFDGNNSEKYEKIIEKRIMDAITSCPKSLFIFEDVHKFEKGLLDKISGLIKFSRFNKQELDLSKAIFIFISNTGKDIILQKTLQFCKHNISRNKFKLSDFESDIMEIAKRSDGFQDSDLINSGFIDYFVPFVPLEKEHIIECINAELQKRQSDYRFSKDFAENVISEATTFEPEPENLFSVTGCKRIPSKISFLNEKGSSPWSKTDDDDVNKFVRHDEF